MEGVVTEELVVGEWSDNRLAKLAYLMASNAKERSDALRRRLRWEWAKLNGLWIEKEPFTPRQITHRDAGPGEWGPRENLWRCRAGWDPAAYVVEPLEGVWLEYRSTKLPHGLAISSPPNPKASFLSPGETVIEVWHRPDLQILWLPEQLAFPDGG